MSGVKGAECEDYDDREAGIEFGVRLFARGSRESTTKDTKVHEGKLPMRIPRGTSCPLWLMSSWIRYARLTASFSAVK